MCNRVRVVAALLAFLCLSGAAGAQESQRATESAATGSIRGRVAAEGKAAAGLPVLLYDERDPRARDAAAVGRTTTDGYGHFAFERVAAGRYTVSVVAPGWVDPEASHFPVSGRGVVVAEGESIETPVVALERGGVVTGRVSDERGRPVVGEFVQLTFLSETGERWTVWLTNRHMLMTDDRGVYRLFGVPRGKYLVSVGASDARDTERNRVQGVSRPLAYHPGVGAAEEAKIVTVGPDVEATNVDITVGARRRVFRVSGRVVDDATGAPVPNVSVALARASDASPDARYASVSSDGRSNARGEFEIAGVRDGGYRLFVYPNDETPERYGEPVDFRVDGSDVSKLVMRLARGGSIGGTVVIEGTDDPSVLARISRLRVLARGARDAKSGLPILGAAPVRVGPDGTFKLAGLAPTSYRLFWDASDAAVEAFSVWRVEYPAGSPTQQIPVAAGADVEGVRLVLVYGTGGLRGRVNFAGRAPVAGSGTSFYVRPSGAPETYGTPGVVDAGGAFSVARLPPGSYEVQVVARFADGPKTAKAIVEVASGAVADVEVSFANGGASPAGGDR